jgi:hypothetical protein
VDVPEVQEVRDEHRRRARRTFRRRRRVRRRRRGRPCFRCWTSPPWRARARSRRTNYDDEETPEMDSESLYGARNRRYGLFQKSTVREMVEW